MDHMVHLNFVIGFLHCVKLSNDGITRNEIVHAWLPSCISNNALLLGPYFTFFLVGSIYEGR
jgi:hypothetical protein